MLKNDPRITYFKEKLFSHKYFPELYTWKYNRMFFFLIYAHARDQPRKFYRRSGNNRS